jgi:hypothetical protein
VLLNLLQQDSIALRVVFRAAVQVAQPVTPEQPDKAARYPFSVIEAPATAAAGAAAPQLGADDEEEKPGPARKR